MSPAWRNDQNQRFCCDVAFSGLCSKVVSLNLFQGRFLRRPGDPQCVKTSISAAISRIMAFISRWSVRAKVAPHDDERRGKRSVSAETFSRNYSFLLERGQFEPFCRAFLDWSSGKWPFCKAILEFSFNTRKLSIWAFLKATLQAPPPRMDRCNRFSSSISRIVAYAFFLKPTCKTLHDDARWVKTSVSAVISLCLKVVSLSPFSWPSGIWRTDRNKRFCSHVLFMQALLRRFLVKRPLLESGQFGYERFCGDFSYNSLDLKVVSLNLESGQFEFF